MPRRIYKARDNEKEIERVGLHNVGENCGEASSREVLVFEYANSLSSDLL